MPGGRLRAGRETVWSSCQLARSILTSWRSENSVQVGGGGASRPPSHRNPRPSCSMQAATRPSGHNCWMPRHWQLRSWSSGARGQAGVSVSQCWIAQDLEGSIGGDTGKEKLSGFAYSLGFFFPLRLKNKLCYRAWDCHVWGEEIRGPMLVPLDSPVMAHIHPLSIE